MARPLSAPDGRPRNAVTATLSDADARLLEEIRIGLGEGASRTDALRVAIRAYAAQRGGSQ